MKMATISGRNM